MFFIIIDNDDNDIFPMKLFNRFQECPTKYKTV